MHPSHYAVVLVCCAIAVLTGCSRYDKVSPAAYEYSKALYSACNRHDETRLSTIALRIDNAKTGSQLTVREADWLHDIVAMAQAGEWQEASQDARQLMEAQVEGM